MPYVLTLVAGAVALRVLAGLGVGGEGLDTSLAAAAAIAGPTAALGLVLAGAARGSKTVASLLLVAWWLFDGASWAHQQVLGRLLAPADLYYALEPATWSVLWPSIRAIVPLWVALPLVAAAGLAAFRLPRRLERLAGPRMAAVVAVAALLGGLGEALRPASESVLPLRYLVAAPPAVPESDSDLALADWRQLQALQGHREPFASGGPAPACGAAERPARQPPTGRSVILVVLEGVGQQEMDAVVGERAVMPELAALAAEGVRVEGFKASGTKTIQAVPSLYSGLPAQPAAHLLQRTPALALQSWVGNVVEAGYRAGYLHGADLSFENKHAYLERAGFEVMGLAPEETAPIYAWGLEDGEMFRRTRAWIEREPGPYLAVYATLGTHHPYGVPPEAPRDWGGGKRNELYAAEAWLDRGLGELADWWRTSQPDALLVLVGDHTSHYDNTVRSLAGSPPDFDTPLIVLGLDDAEERALAELVGPSSQMDLGATLLGLLGLPVPACDQGVDLLGDPDPDRWVLAVDGDRRSVHAFQRDEHFVLDRTAGSVALVDADPATTAAFASDVDRQAALHAFLGLGIEASAWQVANDAFAPRGQAVAVDARPPGVGEPWHATTNLEEALAMEGPVALVLPAERRAEALMALVRQTVAAIHASGRDDVVLVSRIALGARSAARSCRCEVGVLRSALPEADWLADLRDAGVDWVVLEQATETDVRGLHAQGLKVLAGAPVEGVDGVAHLGVRTPERVLLIVVDTLRSDHLGAYGYARDTSPHLDALAQEAVLFEQTYSTSSWTLPSVASIMTSVPPHQHGAEDAETRLPSALPTLAEAFSAQGFPATAFVTHLYVGSRFGLDKGFDSFHEFGLDERFEEGLQPRADAVNAEVMPWLTAQGDTPWFLYLHYFDPHWDYDAPEPWGSRYTDPGYTGSANGTLAFLGQYVPHDQRMSEADRQHLLDLYDGEIAFTDHHLGALVAHLKAEDLWDDTLVVVTADHGEEFQEHGSVHHIRTLYEEVVRVPLLVKPAGGRPALWPARVSTPVSTMDVAPTLLSMAGLQAPDTFRGASLEEVIAGERATPPFMRTVRHASDKAAVRVGDRKLIHQFTQGSTGVVVYDLADDPGEQRPVEQADDARALDQVLIDVLNTPPPVPLVMERATLSGEDEEALRALGYVE